MERNHDYLFMADAMLGKIARKLRMFGFDTIYDPNIDDIDIKDFSIREIQQPNVK